MEQSCVINEKKIIINCIIEISLIFICLISENFLLSFKSHNTKKLIIKKKNEYKVKFKKDMESIIFIWC